MSIKLDMFVCLFCSLFCLFFLFFWGGVVFCLFVFQDVGSLISDQVGMSYIYWTGIWRIKLATIFVNTQWIQDMKLDDGIIKRTLRYPWKGYFPGASCRNNPPENRVLLRHLIHVPYVHFCRPGRAVYLITACRRGELGTSKLSPRDFGEVSGVSLSCRGCIGTFVDTNSRHRQVWTRQMGGKKLRRVWGYTLM